MWHNFRSCAAFSGAALAVGALSAVLAAGEMASYAALRQPAAAPPGWLFSFVWTGLYLLMGVSMGMVWRRTAGQTRRDAASLWCIQLAIHFLWVILFFNLRARLFAFVWLILLLVCAALMTAEFARWSRRAAALQTPYLLWLAFAGYLNLSIWLLNR